MSVSSVCLSVCLSVCNDRLPTREAIKHLNTNPSVSINENRFYPKTGLQKVLSTCSLNFLHWPTFSSYTPCFVHRVGPKPLAIYYWEVQIRHIALHPDSLRVQFFCALKSKSKMLLYACGLIPEAAVLKSLGFTFLVTARFSWQRFCSALVG